MSRSLKQGFTLIEIIVIVAVVGILATVAVLGFGRFQDQSRDAERESSVSVIAEALEKYYDENGEYPSCSTMTAAASSVSNTITVDESALQTPRGSADNAFICSSLSGANDLDNFAYIGDGSTTCTSGNACLQWTIQYRHDETGTIKTLTSRRTAALTSSGAVNLTATSVSASQIDLSWNSVSNATSYRVERSLSAAMTSPTTTSVSTTATSATGLSSGVQYYFRVTPVLGSQDGAAGTANATTAIDAPTGTLSIGASLQSSDTIARGSAGGMTCAGGTTLQYTIGSSERNTNAAITISYPAWGTATTRDVSALQGYNYTFEAKARCVNGAVNGPEVTSAAQSSITRAINAPNAPTYTGDASWFAGYRYNLTFSTACPSGTSLVGGAVDGYDTGFSGSSRTPASGYYTYPRTDWWYLGWSTGQVWEDVNYYGLYRCSTDFTTSGYSPQQTVTVTVDCEVARRSYSADPRCDNYGQASSSLPWGP